jgi:hypothetical protein
MGPCAVLEDPDSNRSYTIDAFNRAAFLYAVLEKTGSAPEGWVPCEGVARAVWGRKATANNVNTLVYRIRRELKAAGFVPDFLEVKRGHVRLVAPHTPYEPEHANELEQLNTALAEYRSAEEDTKAEARKRLALAVERVALVPGLFLEPRP